MVLFPSTVTFTTSVLLGHVIYTIAFPSALTTSCYLLCIPKRALTNAPTDTRAL